MRVKAIECRVFFQYPPEREELVREHSYPICIAVDAIESVEPVQHIFTVRREMVDLGGGRSRSEITETKLVTFAQIRTRSGDIHVVASPNPSFETIASYMREGGP